MKRAAHPVKIQSAALLHSVGDAKHLINIPDVKKASQNHYNI